MTRSRDLANLGDNTSTLENQGLTLINTTTFSAVSSVSLNNVFSSTYRNYKYVVDITATSATSSSLSMRLRANGTDTSANYDNININSAGTVYTYRNETGTDDWYITYMYSGSPDKSFMTGEILRPNLATKTLYNGLGRYELTTFLTMSGIQTDSTQFDGLTLISGTGTMGGVISIYGYKQ